MNAEGSNAKYITGGGQTSATADRVRIYETEGNIKPKKRAAATLTVDSLPSDHPVLTDILSLSSKKFFIEAMLSDDDNSQDGSNVTKKKMRIDAP